jgi:hypothetical protein
MPGSEPRPETRGRETRSRRQQCRPRPRCPDGHGPSFDRQAPLTNDRGQGTTWCTAARVIQPPQTTAICSAARASPASRATQRTSARAKHNTHGTATDRYCACSSCAKSNICPGPRLQGKPRRLALRQREQIQTPMRDLGVRFRAILVHQAGPGDGGTIASTGHHGNDCA